MVSELVPAQMAVSEGTPHLQDKHEYVSIVSKRLEAYKKRARAAEQALKHGKVTTSSQTETALPTASPTANPTDARDLLGDTASEIDHETLANLKRCNDGIQKHCLVSYDSPVLEKVSAHCTACTLVKIKVLESEFGCDRWMFKMWCQGEYRNARPS
jgi:hypothetical protein